MKHLKRKTEFYHFEDYSMKFHQVLDTFPEGSFECLNLAAI